MSEPAYTVLLIGDESFNRQLLVDLLQQRGHRVKKARTATDAERAFREKVDVVVVDQRVRGTNGLALIRRLRGRGLTIPIVFCAGSNCSAKTYNMLRHVLEVSAIVEKPLVPIVLANQIESLLPECGEHNGTALDYEVVQFSPPSESPEESQNMPLLESQQWQLSMDLQEEQETLKALEALGRAYISDVPEMLYELRGQISLAMESGTACQSSTESLSGPLQSAITTAHQMRGTAGSLGFPELSCLAGEVEALLESVDESSASEPLARALMLVADIETWIESWQDSHKDAPVAEGADSILFLSDCADVAGAPVAEMSDEMSDDECSNLSVAVSAPIESVVEIAAPRALIVDNNDLRVQVLTRILRSHGYQLQALPCDVRVLTALQDNPVDLLIVDADGDGLTGFDVCRMIRCHPQWASLPIILMTVDTDLASRKAIYASGASDFIVKPIVEDELLSRLSLFVPRQAVAV